MFKNLIIGTLLTVMLFMTEVYSEYLDVLCFLAVDCVAFAAVCYIEHHVCKYLDMLAKHKRFKNNVMELTKNKLVR